jgi:uncharacterized protein YbjT (DUF2867 family)
MTRTILVTGSTGLVSSALLTELQALTAAEAAPPRVRALVRNPEKAASLKGSKIEIAEGDLDVPESLARAFEGVTDLWLLNGVTPRQPENSMNALHAARAAGVERVVRMSAIGAAHDAPTRNGRLHALSDAELMQSGLKWTILRPHFFMQNLFAVASTVAEQGAFYWDMGEGRLGLIDARDIGAFAARVLLAAPGVHDKKIYTLTGPESLSLSDVAARMTQALGTNVRYVPVPHEAARQSMLQSGMSPWLAGMMFEYASAYERNWGDFVTAHIANVVGRSPRSVEEFVRDHAAMFQRAA